MATTYPSHPSENPSKTHPAPKADAPEVTPLEGTQPAADRVPFHGGGFAKIGGAYSGGCVPDEPDPPPEEDAHAKTAAKK